MDARLSALRAAWLAEWQAVSIYQSELMVLRKTAWTSRRKLSLTLCAQILAEEQAHLGWMGPGEASNGEPGSWVRLSNQLVGWGLGFFLSALPSNLAWRFHAFGERQAAQIYDDVSGVVEDGPLRERLQKARLQELKHSDQFRLAMQGSLNLETIHE